MGTRSIDSIAERFLLVVLLVRYDSQCLSSFESEQGASGLGLFPRGPFFLGVILQSGIVDCCSETRYILSAGWRQSRGLHPNCGTPSKLP